jgi:hypothetical protein
MRGHAVPLSCFCPACRLDQVHELLVSGRTEAARLALEAAARVIRRDQASCCTRVGSVQLPVPRPPSGPEAA